MQNTTHAVMAQRHEPKDSADDFPTPPWATRALIEHVIGTENVGGLSCLEPACGRGHMARTLGEYFAKVTASDAYHYGFGPVRDFLGELDEASLHDWVITNPPFRLAAEFVDRALIAANVGVAILVRTVFLESVGRYNGDLSRPTAINRRAIHGTRSDGKGQARQECEHSHQLCMVRL